jgi:hypothetical protein
VTESGQPLTRAKGIKIVGEKDGYVLIHAESGKYQLEIKN